MIITDFYYALFICMAIGTVAAAALAFRQCGNINSDIGQVCCITLMTLTMLCTGLATQAYFGEDGREAYVREHLSM